MTNEIKIMFLGDIVGRPGRCAVKSYLEKINEDKPDIIIANAENASHGFGLTQKNYEELIGYGIDCFTSGNHIWDKREIFNYINEADRLVRPINYPKGTYGAGYRIIDTPKCSVGIINVLGRTFMGTVDTYFELIDEAIKEIKQKTNVIFIDIHAEASAEKICFARYYAEQGVSLIAGTHTHVQTADERILNGVCGYITDAGFCGAIDSVIGMDYKISIRRMKTSIPERLDVADKGNCQVNGIISKIEISSGKALSIERVNEIIVNEENKDLKG